MDIKNKSDKSHWKLVSQILYIIAISVYITTMLMGIMNILSHASTFVFKTLLTAFPIAWLFGMTIFVQLNTRFDILLIRKYAPDANRTSGKLVLLCKQIGYYGMGSLLIAISFLLVLMSRIQIAI